MFANSVSVPSVAPFNVDFKVSSGFGVVSDDLPMVETLERTVVELEKLFSIDELDDEDWEVI